MRTRTKVIGSALGVSLALGVPYGMAEHATAETADSNPVVSFGYELHRLTGTTADAGSNAEVNSTSVQFGAPDSPFPSTSSSHKANKARSTPTAKASHTTLPSPSPSPDQSPSTSPSTPPSPTSQPSTPNSPSTSTSPSPSPETDPAACIANLPLKLRVGQLTVFGVSADQMSAGASVFDKRHVGGLLLMTAASGDQITEFQSEQHVKALVSTDVEGGGVDRYKDMGFGPMSSQHTAAEIGSIGLAKAMVRNRANNLQAIGINQVYGPVVDIGHDGDALVREDRVFSNDPDTVKAFSVAYANAWLNTDNNGQNAIIPTAKHWPGGVGQDDTDSEASKTLPFSQLNSSLDIYQSMPDGTAIMVSNAIVPGLTHGLPTSLSRDAVTGVLRGQEGFNTLNDLVVTDALNAGAVRNANGGTSLPDAAEQAIAAGADEALIVTDTGSSLDSQISSVTKRLVSAVENGQISEDQLNASVARVLNAKHVDPCDVELN